MRIIAGEARRAPLRAPRGTKTRPTADRVREAIFDVLGPIDAAAAPRVLDLFAGTGALGLEAVSRGAALALLVDRDPACVRVCRENAARARLAERVVARAGEARRVLSALEREGERFDWIFCDPPYATGDLARILERLGSGRLLAPGAVVIAEHSPRNRPQERYGVLGLFDRRRWGSTEASFYRA
jgi:16S rRNA (guanine(966)-N(2))-methyltransferase RsmD